MLVSSDRHTERDLEIWTELEEADRLHYVTANVASKATRAMDAVLEFARKPCYAGVSWGKDSTVLAHLLYRLFDRDRCIVPAYWVVVEPVKNPDCETVEEVFLSHWWLDYHRVGVSCTRDLFGWHVTGTLKKGFCRVARETADRHVSGIRGEESGQRNLRMCRFGTFTTRTCAPLGWWSAADVFAYLAFHGLPVHPVYAMTGGGRWPREHLRVASLGGKRGTGMGRAEWEQEYYGDVLRRLEAKAIT